VNFKNDLERRTFETAKSVCGNAVIEHNKTLRIELATSPEVASFSGPPKKEIDVITAGFQQSPNLKVLISCKDYGTSKAEPADVQEWAAVVHTLNKYSDGTKYLGLIISSSGFTKGCEPWGSSYNLGLIPPLKGKTLKFAAATCNQMVERVLKAFAKRLHFPHDDLLVAPAFYEFVYRLAESFESRDELVQQFGQRYKLLGKGWASSFPEVFKTFEGKAVRDIEMTSAGVSLIFSGNLIFRMTEDQIQFGLDDGTAKEAGVILPCEKNFHGEPCSFDFIKKLVLEQKVTSAGDWGKRFEFGLTDDLMLAIEPNKLQIYRTRNPMEENLL
jgi:hypothetical protein